MAHNHLKASYVDIQAQISKRLTEASFQAGEIRMIKGSNSLQSKRACFMVMIVSTMVKSQSKHSCVVKQNHLYRTVQQQNNNRTCNAENPAINFNIKLWLTHMICMKQSTIQSIWEGVNLQFRADVRYQMIMKLEVKSCGCDFDIITQRNQATSSVNHFISPDHETRRQVSGTHQSYSKSLVKRKRSFLLAFELLL